MQEPAETGTAVDLALLGEMKDARDARGIKRSISAWSSTAVDCSKFGCLSVQLHEYLGHVVIRRLNKVLNCKATRRCPWQVTDPSFALQPRQERYDKFTDTRDQAQLASSLDTLTAASSAAASDL